jgi:Zn-dependent peptidase ImmA (M78 family)/transcriptional regulator with XRE-family HTH domain
MDLDLKMLANKLLRYRSQVAAAISEVSLATGISEHILAAYESGDREPTGDHILILADYYHCDYNFFISNEQLAPFEQTENLFRKHEGQLPKTDRWAILEFLFLCGCEAYLTDLVPRRQNSFEFTKSGTFYKGHGQEAAAALRTHLNYGPTEVPRDVFADFRSLGIHLFRRKLRNSHVSGLFIRHPTVGRCVLVNYSEDPYRQRFTAAHEVGHAILDDGSDPVLSFAGRDNSDRVELRANTFASHYLLPRELLREIPEPDVWTTDKALEWAAHLKVSTAALANALSDATLIDAATAAQLKSVQVPAHLKEDVELPHTLSPASVERRKLLLERGLSNFYVNLCFDAYERGEVSAGRLTEMLLTSRSELTDLADLYGRALSHGD